MPTQTLEQPVRAPEALEELEVRGLRKGFELNQTDFAHMGALALRTVQHWESGQSMPKGAHLKTLREFSKLLTALRRYWEPGALGPWLTAPNQVWAGHRPIDLIHNGHLDMVWRLIYSLDEGDLS